MNNCIAVLKSGSNKGNICNLQAKYGSYCGKHKELNIQETKSNSSQESIENTDDVHQIDKGLGQFFTASEKLQQIVFDLVKYKEELLLEPSVGAGHLLQKFKSFNEKYPIKSYEIDKKIKPIIDIEVIYNDFLLAEETTLFKTIIANPPFNKTLEFVNKCFNLLKDNGEMIFICPSKFLKMSSSSKLILKMKEKGSFTHFVFPNNEKLFKDASVDVAIFRYEKDLHLPEGKALVANSIEENPKDNQSQWKEMFCNLNKGIITFSLEDTSTKTRFSDIFKVIVGAVSGRDEIFEQDFGNLSFLTAEDRFEHYICIDDFPSNDEKINKHLLENKEELLSRGGSVFNEKNWFKWTRLPFKKEIEETYGNPCIYVKNITRNKAVSFVGKISLFAKALICLIPKSPETDLSKVVDYLNSDKFRSNYTYSGRFMIGQKQLAGAVLEMI